MKWFVRLSYDNANEIGRREPVEFSQSVERSGSVFGLDWNRRRFVNSARFGYQRW